MEQLAEMGDPNVDDKRELGSKSQLLLSLDVGIAAACGEEERREVSLVSKYLNKGFFLIAFAKIPNSFILICISSKLEEVL